MKTIHEPAREIPVLAEVDVLVAGGGPSGLMAAQAAARLALATGVPPSAVNVAHLQRALLANGACLG